MRGASLGAPRGIAGARRRAAECHVYATFEQQLQRATRAVETAAALRRLGYKPDEVKAAVDATRAHVGNYDLPIEQWIGIALSKCLRPAS